jgi:hypothetical protein
MLDGVTRGLAAEALEQLYEAALAEPDRRDRGAGVTLDHVREARISDEDVQQLIVENARRERAAPAGTMIPSWRFPRNRATASRRMPPISLKCAQDSAKATSSPSQNTGEASLPCRAEFF